MRGGGVNIKALLQFSSSPPIHFFCDDFRYTIFVEIEQLQPRDFVSSEGLNRRAIGPQRGKPAAVVCRDRDDSDSSTNFELASKSEAGQVDIPHLLSWTVGHSSVPPSAHLTPFIRRLSPPSFHKLHAH